jgi:hypothetical protein
MAPDALLKDGAPAIDAIIRKNRPDALFIAASRRHDEKPFSGPLGHVSDGFILFHVKLSHALHVLVFHQPEAQLPWPQQQPVFIHALVFR